MKKRKACSQLLILATLIGITASVFPMSTAAESPSYTTDGSTITLTQSCKLDLTDIEYKHIDGKQFVGWVDENGNAPQNNSTLRSGTELRAEYIDFNANGATDFAVIRTEIRTTPSTGLRFIIEKSNRLADELPNISEYGAVVLPSLVLTGQNRWKDLTIDGVYSYNGTKYTPAIIRTEKIFDVLEDSVRYTLCLTNVSAEKLTRQYTVKGYIRFTDLNGIERVAYTDYSSVNPYETAKQTLNGGDLSDAGKSAVNALISEVKAIQAKKFDRNDREDIVGSEADPTTWIYRLNSSSWYTPRLYVREATFDSGKGGDPVEIVQITDTHWNYINDRDREEQNPTLMSTVSKRLWGVNALFIPNTRATIDYARTADQVVFTGDMLDYLSWGTVELLRKELYDVLPDAMATPGNHEFVQMMQGTVGETLSREQRVNWLAQYWNGDMFYSSKVLDDKVMLITMMNGEHVFYESQIEPLNRDIEAARNNGYIVLLFMHESLTTNNPAETAVNALLAGDPGWATNENFCSNPQNHHVGGPNSTGATKTVYDIITNNADVIKGVFNGHTHCDFYTEIIAKTHSGEDTVIPQYTLNGTAYDKGHVLKITVK